MAIENAKLDKPIPVECRCGRSFIAYSHVTVCRECAMKICAPCYERGDY